ncbi:MAG: hypothetical protein WB660_16015 [Candidatus Sulfotelmatobacter sp.]
MDMAQVFIFDLGWVFFAAWGTILVAVGVIAFGRDILRFTDQEDGDKPPQAHR